MGKNLLPATRQVRGLQTALSDNIPKRVGNHYFIVFNGFSNDMKYNIVKVTSIMAIKLLQWKNLFVNTVYNQRKVIAYINIKAIGGCSPKLTKNK